MSINKNKIWKLLVLAGLFIMTMNSSATTHLLIRTTEGTPFQKKGDLLAVEMVTAGMATGPSMDDGESIKALPITSDCSVLTQHGFVSESEEIRQVAKDVYYVTWTENKDALEVLEPIPCVNSSDASVVIKPFIVVVPEKQSRISKQRLTEKIRISDEFIHSKLLYKGDLKTELSSKSNYRLIVEEVSSGIGNQLPDYTALRHLGRSFLKGAQNVLGLREKGGNAPQQQPDIIEDLDGSISTVVRNSGGDDGPEPDPDPEPELPEVEQPPTPEVPGRLAFFVNWMLQSLYKGGTVVADSAFHVYVPFSFSIAPYSWSPPWVAHAIEAVRVVSYPISGWVYTSLPDTVEEGGRTDEEVGGNSEGGLHSGQNNAQPMWQLYAKKSLMLSGKALKYATAPYWFAGKMVNTGIVAAAKRPFELRKQRQKYEEEKELIRERIEAFEQLSITKRIQKLRTIVRNSQNKIVDVRFKFDKFEEIYGERLFDGELRESFSTGGQLGYYLGLIYWPPYLEKLVPDYFKSIATREDRQKYMIGHNPLKLDADITLEDVTGCDTEIDALNIFAHARMSAIVKTRSDYQYRGSEEAKNYYLGSLMHEALAKKYKDNPERVKYHKQFLAFMASASSKEYLRKLPPGLRKQARQVCSWGF